MALLQLLEEGAEQPYGDIISTVVVVAVAGEVTLDLEVSNDTVFVTNALNLCILDSGQGIYNVREACDTSCECTSYVGIDKSHLGSLVVVLIVHVVDKVQSVYIDGSEPCHHSVVLLHNLIIIKVLRCDRSVSRTYLSLSLSVDTAVDSVHQALSEVCTSAEELHFLTGLCCGYAAADGVIVAPNRTHNVIVLVLNRGGTNGDSCCIALEVIRQLVAVQNCHVRLRGRAHVLEGVQETEVVLGNHGTAVLTLTADGQCSPYRVAGEQLVVGRNTSELNHSELEYEVVDELLSLSLSQSAVVDVTLDIDIEECRDTADGHCSAVLGLDSSQIAEVCPLNSLACVCSRLGDIAAAGTHNLHLLECADLVSQLFTLTDNGISHLTVAAVSKVVLLCFYKSVDTVEGDTSVVAYDTAAAVCIRKTGDDLVLSYSAHLGSVSVEYALVVSLVIFCEDLVQLRIRCVTVSCASLFSHLDAAVGHECSLEGLISLKTNDLLKILHLRIDVAGLM